MKFIRNDISMPRFYFRARREEHRTATYVSIREDSSTTATPPWRNGSREAKDGCVDIVTFVQEIP